MAVALTSGEGLTPGVASADDDALGASVVEDGVAPNEVVAGALDDVLADAVASPIGARLEGESDAVATDDAGAADSVNSASTRGASESDGVSEGSAEAEPDGVGAVVEDDELDDDADAVGVGVAVADSDAGVSGVAEKEGVGDADADASEGDKDGDGSSTGGDDARACGGTQRSGGVAGIAQSSSLGSAVVVTGAAG